MAVPYLEKGVLPEARVIHLVRHPMACVRSFTGIRFFEEQDNKYAQFMRRHFECRGDPVDDAMRWWVEWNIRCGRLAHERLLLEQLENSHERLPEALGLKGRRRIHFSRVPKHINSRNRCQLAVEDLYEKASFAALKELADQYGYKL